MINKNRYREALIFTFKLHSKQFRKDTKIPYFFHLSSVSNLVIENGGNTDEAIAGLLHDAVEDQGGEKTLKLIKRKFGNKVAKIVEDCTEGLSKSLGNSTLNISNGDIKHDLIINYDRYSDYEVKYIKSIDTELRTMDLIYTKLSRLGFLN